MGWNARETAATAGTATLRVINGALGSGTAFIVTRELGPNESAEEWYGADGPVAPDGLSVDWIAGTFEIVLHYNE